MTTLRLAHNHTICHCQSCERLNRSHVRQVIVVYLPRAIAALFGGFILYHLIRWMVAGFPGLLRIGGM